MCGIVGAFGKHLDINASAVERGLRVIQHRGPDDVGVASPSSQLVLGHRRLSILDLSIAGHQPMEIDKNWIVFNGEIYNHLSLRLERLSSEFFSSTSDTETVLRLLNRYGIEIVAELKGMFAAAWYNSLENKVYLFRDSLGIKPLFYMENSAPSSVFFSSEIKSLLAMTEASTFVNQYVLNQYLSFENYSDESSLFLGINSIKKGEIRAYTIDGDIVRHQSTFFSPSAEEPKNADIDLVYQLEAQIRASIQSHLISDVPIGVYLSGGIDSSLVATLAAQSSSNLIGFIGYFEDKDDHYDERKLARLVADKCNFPLREVKITPENFIQNFDKIIYHLDQPRMGMGAFSQYIVAAEAAKHRKVILAGHGGDELFAGYPLHRATFLLASKGMGLGNWKNLRKMRGKEWPWYLYSLLKWLLTGRIYFAPRIWRRKSFPIPEAFLSRKKDLLGSLDRYYNEVYIPGLLEVEDRISMAHGLETRVPLWSQDLVSFAREIKIEDKLKNGELKHLLKKVAERWLPPELLSAPKRGFPTPLRNWFRNELLQFVSDRLLNSTNDIFYSFFSKKELEQILISHRYKKLPFALDELRAHRIWTALCVESWLRQFNVEKK